MRELARSAARARGLVAVLGTIGGVAAQVAWTKPEVLEARLQHAMAFHAATSEIVLFGGLRLPGHNLFSGETWCFDGVRWSLRRPATAPSARAGHVMAYDVARRRTVLFGGSAAATGFADTWEWDGATWFQRTPAASPPIASHCMAHDSVRGRTVLFCSDGLTTSETWEWDGTSWTKRTSTYTPTPRTGAQAAFDAGRGRVVLYGGNRYGLNTVTLDGTWEWDGTDWSLPSFPSAPGARTSHTMCYDAARARTVLHGNGPQGAETWTWDGSTWSQVVPAPAPAPGAVAPLAFDAARGLCVLFGGVERADTWTFDGVRWQVVVGGPAPRFSGALAHHPGGGHVLSFGGQIGSTMTDETWAWNGRDWKLLRPAIAPAARRSHALCYDAALARIVLFGGDSGNSGRFGDTWHWDGAAWAQQSPATSPPPATTGAMAFHAARQKTMLMFGDLQAKTNQHWQWDGSSWTQLASAPMSGPVGHQAVVYDAARDRLVAVQDRTWNGSPNLETWEWDGNAWTQRQPSQRPPSRQLFALAYDPLRARTVLHAGVFLGVFNDTWEWDGVDWQQRTTSLVPISHYLPMLAFDATRQTLVLWGGNICELWEYAATTPAAFTPFGKGCGGPAGVPALRATRLPWLGEDFELRLQNLPAGQPAILKIGLSDRQSGAIPLPLPLDSFGMPGCTAYVSHEAVLPVANPSGQATLRVPLASNPAWLGLTLFQQGAVLAPAANAAGLLLSDAGRALLGGK